MLHPPHLFENFPFYSKSRNEIIHYTCNAPTKKILNKHQITCLGKDFNSDEREVLAIPLKTYEKFSFKNLQDKNVLKINSEIIMRSLK